MDINFDARSVAPSQPMEPVPEGWYPVVISDEEQKGVNGKPQCWLLALTMEIIDGPAKGRKLFTNLNLGNDNQQAVEIASRELSAVCHVTGMFVLSSQTGGTAALKGKPFMVKAVVSNGRNEIKGYKDMQGNDPGKTGAGGQPHAPAAPQAPAAPPQAPAAAPAWGGAPAAAPAAPAAPAWGGQPQQPAAAPQAPAWGGAPAAPAAPAWGGGAPAPAAAPAAPAAGPAWAPQGAAPSQAPWAR